MVRSRVLRRFALASLILSSQACQREPAAPPQQARVVGPKVAASVVEAEPPVAPHVPGRESAALADAEVDRARDAVLGERTQRASVAPNPQRRWDRHTPPRGLDRVTERVGLTGAESEALAKNGFVVLERMSFRSYGDAFDFVHRRELPLYVSSDALLYALFRSHSDVVESLETESQLRLVKVLAAMHAALPKAQRSYAADVAADADLYLAVARWFLAFATSKTGRAAVLSTLGRGDVAKPWVERILRFGGPETVTLFGRKRVLDFSQWRPVGLYAQGLEAYYVAYKWLSRVELGLSTRGAVAPGSGAFRGETPREATLALVLADLASRAGVLADLRALDARGRSLAGPREDVPPADLVDLGQGLDLTRPEAAAEALRARIGARYARTLATEPVEEKQALPVVATLLGIGINADARALSRLTEDRDLRGADVAVALGHDAALPFTEGLAPAKVALAREQLHAVDTANAYGAWLGVVRSLAITGDGGRLPSFASGPGFASLRASSAVAGYGALRSVYALQTPLVERTGGCTIPDAYVEPHGALFDALSTYAARMESFVPELAAFAAWLEGEMRSANERGARASAKMKVKADPKLDELTSWIMENRAYMAGAPLDRARQPLRFSKTIAALRAIAEDERAGRALSREQLAFLGMVSEYHPYDMYAAERTPARYNGWYPRLFATRTQAFDRAVYAGDVAASRVSGSVLQVGGLEPHLGVFVVDTQGEPRVVVGPVGSSFSRAVPAVPSPASESLADVATTRAMPWEARYTVAAPEWKTRFVYARERKGVLSVDALEPMGPATVERVDPHGATLSTGPLPTTNGAPVVLTPVPRAVSAKPSTTFVRLRRADGVTVEVSLGVEGD